MTDADQAVEAEEPAKKEEDWRDFASFLIKLLIFFLLLRSFIISPFNIPSESMLPRLYTGDYLLVTKWNYGYSRFSLPWNVPLIPGHIFASEPVPGDVAVFKSPPNGANDIIKRVIGLPGDSIAMRDGQLILNGKAVPKVKVDDLLLPVSPNTGCISPEFYERNASGEGVCRYPRFKETLPNGRSYYVLDLFDTPKDNYGPVIVPEDRIFVMGDNRDNSADSRTPVAESGMGMVPEEMLVGKALVTVFSTDGSASWFLPWTWFSAARWERIGEGF